MSSHALRTVPVVAFVAAIATACAGTSPPAFYTLSPASGAAAGAAITSRPDLGLVVGPLELPRYLDRRELVTRDGAHRLVVADAHRWGGSMSSDVLRVVAGDLGRLLGTARVAVAYGAHDTQALRDHGPLFLAHSTRELHDWLLQNA